MGSTVVELVFHILDRLCYVMCVMCNVHVLVFLGKNLIATCVDGFLRLSA